MSNYYELPRSTPEAQGISSSSILSFLNAVEERKLQLHGFMFLRHGHVVAEGWWSPYHPSCPHSAYSVTKSFTSTAVGFAIQEGLLSVEDQVLPFFPNLLTKGIKLNMGTLKVKHLLTMSTGHNQDLLRFKGLFQFLKDKTVLSIGNEKNENWVRAFFDFPIEISPGTQFQYNSGASQMLSEIVTRVTGQTLLNYLQPRLFEPLGIQRPIWEFSPQGTNTGGWGLRLKTEDLARFGLLFLQKGVWDGKRLLSQSWVEEATSKQIETTPIQNKPDWGQGYGYQFWRSRHDTYRADGAFGQFIIVLPNKDAVISINSGEKAMQEVLELIWEMLLPFMKSEALPNDIPSHLSLVRKLKSLSILQKPWSEGQTYISKYCYKMEPNDDEVESVLFDFHYDKCIFKWRNPSGVNQIVCGLIEWYIDDKILPGEIIAIKGIWSNEKTFIIHLVRIFSGYHDKLYCHFEIGRVYLEYSHNNFIFSKERKLVGNLEFS
ncbi:serine hydrolase domain-containing protein [Paenibacillus andongensis]|uniref:serine hydrolase domain-containing protein n=1 Tax=Paenibacillus andongensis TaxID=2975482 RepID=UPI0021BB3A38|nr:serine hydrolase [Paenibacillus andongensis]